MQHHMHAKGLVERSQRSAADLIPTLKQFEDEEGLITMLMAITTLVNDFF